MQNYEKLQQLKTKVNGFIIVDFLYRSVDQLLV